MNILPRLTSVVLTVLFTALVLFQGVGAALSQEQLDLFQRNIHYFNAAVCGADSNTDTSSATTGSGAPNGAKYPNLDATAMTNSINNFINSENPDSELKGLGKTIVDSAKDANINPFLIVAIAHEESALADPSDTNVKQANNSFGRMATASQPHWQGARLWYKWSSIKASVDYTAPENKNASGGGDIAAYLRNQYSDKIDSGDLLSLFLAYAPPGDSNDTDAYTSNVKGWIRQLVKGAGSASNPSVNSTDTTSVCSCLSSDANLTGKDAQEKIFNFFVGKNLSEEQAAAFVGNFGQESSWDPKANQPNGPGRGIAQWSEGDRWDTNSNGNVVDYAKDTGGDPEDLATQLGFVWYELTHSYANVLKQLKQTTDVASATTIISSQYEAAGTPNLPNRVKLANDALDAYGTGNSGGGNFNTCEGGAVDCQNPDTAANNLSEVRRSVVCLAEQELERWNTNKMKPGFRKSSSDSYTKYSQNTEESWCADFTSWLYKQAGYPLQPGNDWRVALVANQQSIGEKNDKFHWHPSGGSYTPKPGDIAVHSASHVNLVVDVNGNSVTLIGGNQTPDERGYPNGSRVSEYKVTGFSGEGITGYVSPD